MTPHYHLKNKYAVYLFGLICVISPLFVIGFCSDISQAGGAFPFFNYYVDSVNGDDANNGLGPGTAFRTISRVLSAVGSQPNESIGLARGSVWKEELLLSANPGTTLASYGAGTMPLIDAGDTISPVSFTPTAGSPSTYQAALVFTGPTGVEQRLVWENNKNLIQVADIATVSSTPGSFFFDSYTAPSSIVYVHTSDGSDPSTNGRTYDYTKRFYGINIVGDNVTINGIRTRRQRNNNGSVVIMGDHGLLENGIAEDGHKHAAYMQESATISRYIFRNAYNGIDGFPNLVVFNKNIGLGLGMSVSFCQFIIDPGVVPSVSGVPLQLATSIISHLNQSGSLGAIVTNGNTHTLTKGYGLAGTSAQTFNTDAFTDCQYMGNTPDPVAVVFNRPVFTFTKQLSGPSMFFYSDSPASGRVSVTYNNGSWNTATFNVSISGNSLDTYFNGGTIVTGAMVGNPDGVIQIAGTGNTLTVNGLVLDATAWPSPRFYSLQADTVYQGDHNVFAYTTGVPSWVVNHVIVAASLAGWQAYSGQDAGST